MDTNRNRYLVAYDIADHKRLYRVHKKVEAYAIGGQKSFYECWLTTHELSVFRNELLDLINLEEDRIFIFQIYRDTKPLLFGIAQLQATEPFLVI